LAKSQTEAQLRAQLGEEKFRQFKRGEDEDYHRLSAALTRLKLPHQKADEIYDMKQALAEARQLAATNGNLTAEQRNNLLRTLSDETERAARQVLGEKGYNSLVRSGSAQWLQN